MEADRIKMSQVIRQVTRPCLALKILAAGRLTRRPQELETASQDAFRQIKKTDGIIVGMYPRFSEEVARNVILTLKHGQPGC